MFAKKITSAKKYGAFGILAVFAVIGLGLESSVKATSATYQRIDTFLTDGTWTAPDGVTSATVEAWGAGGGGTINVGAGGGGAYARTTVAVTPGNDYDVVVGISAANTDGELSSFNASTVMAEGGLSGVNLGIGGKAGARWTERQPAGAADRVWYRYAIDEDGSVMIAGEVAGRLYTSTNGGVSWTERQPAGAADRAWRDVGISADGNTMIAVLNAGRIYTSSNGGVNWTERQPKGNVNGSWRGAAVSDDGTTMIVGEYPGRLYTSSNGGVDWTERQPAGAVDGNWRAIGIDEDGTTMIVGSDVGRLYTSSNGGVNWTERQPAGAVNGNWYGAKVNDDGSTMIAGNFGGRLYTSSNGGVNWTERQPAGNVSKTWRGVDISGNGSTMIAVISGGRVYASSNGGVDWKESRPAGDTDKNWDGAGVSGDGGTMLIGVLTGRLYTSVNGIGDVRFNGGNGDTGTGDRHGGGGAGDTEAGGNGGVGALPGVGGSTNGAMGGGYNYSSTLFGGGGGSTGAAAMEGNRGEVRITYNVDSLSNQPRIMARSWGREATGSNSHVISLPSEIKTGELLLVDFGADGSPTLSANGWEKVGQETAGGSVTKGIFYKFATGGDTLTVETTSSVRASWIAYRIADAQIPETAFFGGNDDEADPPSLSPIIRSDNYLGLASVTWDFWEAGSSVLIGPPADHESFVTVQVGDRGNADAITMGAAAQLFFGSLVDPGVFSHNGNTVQFVAATTAITYRPLSGRENVAEPLCSFQPPVMDILKHPEVLSRDDGGSSVRVEWESQRETIDFLADRKTQAFMSYLNYSSDTTIGRDERNFAEMNAKYLYGETQKNEELAHEFWLTMREVSSHEPPEVKALLEPSGLKKTFRDWWEIILIDRIMQDRELGIAFKSAIKEELKNTEAGASFDVVAIIRRFLENMTQVKDRPTLKTAISCIQSKKMGKSWNNLLTWRQKEQLKEMPLMEALEALGGDLGLKDSLMDTLDSLSTKELMDKLKENRNVMNLVELWIQDEEVRDFRDHFFKNPFGEYAENCLRYSYGMSIKEWADTIRANILSQSLKEGFTQNTEEKTKLILRTIEALWRKQGTGGMMESIIASLSRDLLLADRILKEGGEKGILWGGSGELDPIQFYKTEVSQQEKNGVSDTIITEVWRENDLIYTTNNSNERSFLDNTIPLNTGERIEHIRYKIITRTECNQAAGRVKEVPIQPFLSKGMKVSVMADLDLISLLEQKNEAFLHALEVMITASEKKEEGNGRIAPDILGRAKKNGVMGIDREAKRKIRCGGEYACSGGTQKAVDEQFAQAGLAGDITISISKVGETPSHEVSAYLNLFGEAKSIELGTLEGQTDYEIRIFGNNLPMEVVLNYRPDNALHGKHGFTTKAAFGLKKNGDQNPAGVNYATLREKLTKGNENTPLHGAAPKDTSIPFENEEWLESF